MLAVEDDEPKPSFALPGTNPDRKCVILDGKRHLDWHPRRSSHDSVDCLAIGSHRLTAPVDDHLRRVDALEAEYSGVPFLTGGCCRARERITPAEAVPIIDVESERQHVWPPRQFH